MLDITATDDLDEAVKEAIWDELGQFNHERNAVFFAAREQHPPRPLYIVARDSEGNLLGGLFGESQLAWLKLSIMAIVPSARGLGIGTRLLTAAEAQAAARGCRHLYADTMEYQAPGFYEKRGYQLAGKLEDWDSHGHAKFFFVKHL